MRIVAQSREAPRGERLRARQLDPIASKRTSTRAVTTYLQYPALQTGAVMLRLQAPIDLDQALKLLAAHAAVAGTPERDRP